MRLTLRTLIAFRDQVLPEAQQNHLADRIQEVDFAKQLLNRCEAVLPNSRVSDELMLLDGNITANYLDSVLNDAATQRFEQVALTDDNLLSEVAECHQILSGYEEQIHSDTDHKCRQRLHALQRGGVSDVTVPPVDWSEYEVAVADDQDDSWITPRNLLGPGTSAILNGAMLIILSLLTVGAAHKTPPIELSISEGIDEVEVMVDMPENLDLEMDTEEFAELVAEPIDLPTESPSLDDHFFEEMQSQPAAASTTFEASRVLASLNSGGGPVTSGGSPKNGKPSIKYYGKEYSAKDVVYIVDASGSMRGKRFHRACDELLYSLNNLDPSQRFAILFFSGRNVRSFPGGTQLSKANRRNISKARRLIKTTNPHGGTEPSKSLINALAREPELVFFLSDGEIPDDTIIDAREANQDYAVINTIGFEYRFGARLLRALAEQNSGEYRFVP